MKIRKIPLKKNGTRGYFPEFDNIMIGIIVSIILYTILHFLGN